MKNYKETTTFPMDFMIAEKFGVDAIQDTYNNAMKSWKHSIGYMTELVIALNHRLWATYESGQMDVAKLYDTIWRDADNYVRENFKGDELNFFYREID